MLQLFEKRNLVNTQDARYGEGFCSSDLNFFDDNSQIILNLANDLEDICKKALDINEIIISESFYNVFKCGSGAKPHAHIGDKDNYFNLHLYKYSLIYYLEVGDQKGEDPGKLSLYMNTIQKKLLVAYFLVNTMSTIFYPSLILLIGVSCITLFLYFRYKS